MRQERQSLFVVQEYASSEETRPQAEINLKILKQQQRVKQSSSKEDRTVPSLLRKRMCYFLAAQFLVHKECWSCNVFVRTETYLTVNLCYGNMATLLDFCCNPLHFDSLS